MLETARLVLRPFTVADTPALLALSHEPALRRWLPDQVYRDLAHAEAVTRALIAFTDQPPAPAVRPFVLGVAARDTGTLIGHVGLSPARGSVEIGYAIAEAVHGQGLATEAVAAATRWALEVLHVPEVLGIVAVDNVGSQRVLAKAGYARVGDAVIRGEPAVVYRASGSGTIDG